MSHTAILGTSNEPGNEEAREESTSTSGECDSNSSAQLSLGVLEVFDVRPGATMDIVQRHRLRLLKQDHGQEIFWSKRRSPYVLIRLGRDELSFARIASAAFCCVSGKTAQDLLNGVPNNPGHEELLQMHWLTLCFQSPGMAQLLLRTAPAQLLLRWCQHVKCMDIRDPSHLAFKLP